MFESLFKGYDLRGIVPSELNEEIAENLGKAFASMLFEENLDSAPVIVGRDNRLHSERLSKAFISGLTFAGINVLDFGQVATPTFYHAIAVQKANGAMITASHNPKEYNGFKMIYEFKPMTSMKMQKLKSILESKTFYSSGKKGIVMNRKIEDDYLKYLLNSVNISKKFKVAVDCGNGMGFGVGVEMLERLSFNLVKLYCESDGNYPNHQPDPHKYSTLADLQKAVLENECDLGIAFDGDVDRVGFVDDKGRIVTEDDVQILCALNELKKKPGSSVVYDLRTSLALSEMVEKAGGRAFISKAGRLFVRELMLERNAVFAGEVSGHYIFKDNYCYDDGFFAALKVLEFLSSSGKKLSQLIDEIPKYYSTAEMRLSVPEEKKFAMVAKIRDEFEKNFKVLSIDGIRLELDGAWGLLRASNTEPAITLRFEGKSKEKLRQVYSLFQKELDKYGILLISIDNLVA